MKRPKSRTCAYYDELSMMDWCACYAEDYLRLRNFKKTATKQDPKPPYGIFSTNPTIPRKGDSDARP